LTAESTPTFLRQGWYGLGPGSLGTGVPALRLALERLVSSPELRRELGLFGHRLVKERFCLNHAAETLEEVYLSAVQNPTPSEHLFADFFHVSAGLIGNKLQRKYRRRFGVAPTDDSNARNLVAKVLANGEINKLGPPSGEQANGK
jgi:hypothetical protein